MRTVLAGLGVLLLAAPLASAQPKSAPADNANPISRSLVFGYERVKKNITAAAEKMPADQYNYRPTPDVRSFGQLIGHLADSSIMFCGVAKKQTGGKKPDFEKTATTKAALQKALAEGFAACDELYAKGTDAELLQPVELFGQKMIRFTPLDINIGHDNEHYGNIVTYMRMVKLVPPSSEKQKKE